MSLVDKLKTFDLWVTRIVSMIAVLGMTFGVLVTFINVVLRYLFNTGLPWAGELTNFLFAVSALFSAAYGFKKGTHIAMSNLLEKLKPKVAKAVLITTHFITIIYLFGISYYGFILVSEYKELGQMSVDLGIGVWIMQLIVPVTFLLAGFMMLRKLYISFYTDAEHVVFDQEKEMIKETVNKDEI